TGAHQPDLYAYFDSQQLTQALVNLLLNAIQATPAHGRIQVYVDDRKDEVEIIVQDGGPGLSDEQREHLFEPFYTTKPGGTGLGLAISRELMRSQGGDLVYRANETGARFVIQLPKEAWCQPQQS
ncbi:MAG: ATP-binding protein, partial [Acidobacteriaceae bacterium]|nr:ATP-binding protein [Acidobacteriaceae bacterium]